MHLAIDEQQTDVMLRHLDGHNMLGRRPPSRGRLRFRLQRQAVRQREVSAMSMRATRTSIALPVQACVYLEQ